MIGGFFRSGIFRLTAWALIVALSLPFGLPLGEQRADAAEGGLLVAVAGLQNQTGRDILPDDYGIGSIISTATRVEGIEIVPADRMLDLLRGEPDKETALGAAGAAGADMVLFGKVTEIEFEEKQNALVTVELYLYSTGTGEELLSKSRVIGASGEKFGYQGELAALAEEALRNAMDDSVDDLFDNLSSYGMITLVDSHGAIFTDFTSSAGVTPGSELAVVRDYEQIATLKVEESKTSHTVAKLSDLKPGFQVEKGDKVRVVYKPQAVVKTSPQEQIKKKKKLNPIVIGVLAVGIIVALTQGKGKADDVVEQQRIYSSRSSDGVAYVYAKNGFTPDYTPKTPQKQDIAATSLNACYSKDTDCVWTGATNSNCSTQIYVVNDSTYEYSLATNPKNPTLPAGWYIAVDMSKFPNAPSPTNTTNRVKFAQCNATTGEWEMLDSTYGSNSTLKLSQAVSSPVTHFSPYVVVVDSRPEPISTPSLNVTCGDDFTTLTWNVSTDTDFKEYAIYSCTDSSSSSCNLKTSISSISTITQSYAGLSQNTEYCYAMRINSDSGLRDSNLSNVVCKTTGSCSAGDGEITLISPANGAQITIDEPTFVFIGTGDSDKYILDVWGKDANGQQAIIFSETIDGEGSSNTGGPEVYDSIEYDGPSLVASDTYRWIVTGLNQTTGGQKQSQEFSFTFKSSGQTGTTTECNPSVIPGVPTLVTPNNGAQIAVDTPTFQWSAVSSATSYTITVYNAQGQIVYQKNVSSNIDTSYDGDPLKNNESYSWTIRSHTDCAASMESSAFQFTKISTDVAPLPAPEWVDPATDGKSPITQIDGGDQYIVRLYWRQVNSSNLAGYKVYRCETQSECSAVNQSNLLAVIFKEQLTAPPPNVNCGSFSELSPGYCDISATNGMRHYYIVTAFDNTQQDSDPTVPQNILLSLKRPTLISPGGVTPTNITTASPMFTWQAVPGDDVQYLLKVTNDSSGLIVWETTQSGSSAVYSGTTALVDENTYSWTVKAFNNLVTSDNSQTFKFTKKASTTKPDPPLWCDDTDATKCTTSLGIGAPNYTRNSITLYWQMDTSTDVQQYYIYRATSESGLPNANENSGTLIGVAQNTSCSSGQFDVCFEDRGDNGTGLPRGEYYYYAIKTVDSGGTTSLPSKTRSILNYALVGAQLIYPSKDQYVFDPQPEFTWLEELGADSYRLELEPSDGTWSPTNLYWVKVTTALSAIYGQGEPPPRMPLENPQNPSNPNKSYHWRVCSINANYPTGKCEGAVYKFTKWLKQPEPKYPTGGEMVSTNDITFKWTASPGAAGYQLRIYRKDAGSEIVMVNQDLQGENTTSQQLTLALVNGTTYYWKIRAYDSFGAVSGEWSLIAEEPSFIKADMESPVLVLPINNQLVGPKTDCSIGVDMYGNPAYNYEIPFSWTPVNGAEGYKIKIEEEVDAPSLTFATVWETTTSSTTELNVNTNCQATAVQCEPAPCGRTICCDNNPPGLAPTAKIPFSSGRRYRWNVAELNSEYDDAGARYYVTGLPAPNPLEPFAGSSVIIRDDCDGLSGKICVHFDWDDVLGAAKYEIEIVSDGQYFRCEPGNVPTPATGTTSVNTSSCDLSTQTAANQDLFSWRVRARDGNSEPIEDGNPGPWSVSGYFSVFIPPPVLASPPNSTPEPGGCVTAAQSQGFAPYDFCTIVPCQDLSFYWSPIPVSDAYYKIQVSDTEDFRNIIFEDNNTTGGYTGLCASTCNPWQNCCILSSDNVAQLVNGVIYYWRVGAGVPKEGAATCCDSWAYSEPYHFYKSPPPVPNVSFKDLDYNTVTITWIRPVNCDGDVTKAALSTPIVPDDPNSTLAGYLIYMDTGGNFPEGCAAPDNLIGRVSAGMTEWTPPAGLVQESSEYVFCVVVRDNSGIEPWAGSMSCPSCVYVTTPENPNP